MDFDTAQWREKQRSIYNKDFKDALATPEITIQSSIQGLDAGCLIVLKYPSTLCANLERASEAICGPLEYIPYDETNLHTTLLTGPKLSARSASNASEYSQFDKARTLFEQQLPQLTKQLTDIQLELTDLLVNSNSLIAATSASDAFWHMAHQLQGIFSEAGLEWKMPWGSHLTLARFLQSDTPFPVNPDAVSPALLATISELVPSSIELIWFECDADGFRIV